MDQSSPGVSGGGGEQQQAGLSRAGTAASAEARSARGGNAEAGLHPAVPAVAKPSLRRLLV